MASAAPALGRFTIGGVVNRMVAGISGNWKTLLIVAVVTAAITALLSSLSMSQLVNFMNASRSSSDSIAGAAAFAMFSSPAYWTTVIGSMVIGSYALTSLLAALVGRDGGAATPGEAFAIGLRRFLPMVALTILWALGLMVGYLLIIIPALILLTIWAVSAPALVAEGLNPIAAFGRSRALTKGFRWPVFGALLLFGVVYMTIAFGAQGGSTMGMIALYQTSPVLGLTVGVLISSVTGILNASFLAALYSELREAKEGGSESKLADVFA